MEPSNDNPAGCNIVVIMSIVAIVVIALAAFNFFAAWAT